MEKILNWFKEKDARWLSSKEGDDILKDTEEKMDSIRVTAISIDYLRQLNAVIQFNEEAVQKMALQLHPAVGDVPNEMSFLHSFNYEKVKHITVRHQCQNGRPLK